MGWFAEGLEFEREVRDRDGKTAKVWLKPRSGDDQVMLENRVDAAGDNANFLVGDFNIDGIMLSLVRWDLPEPVSKAAVGKLDLYVYQQLGQLVDAINSPEVEPAVEAAPVTPLPLSNGKSTDSIEELAVTSSS